MDPAVLKKSHASFLWGSKGHAPLSWIRASVLCVGPKPLFPSLLHREGNGQILRATACQREAGQSPKENFE